MYKGLEERRGGKEEGIRELGDGQRKSVVQLILHDARLQASARPGMTARWIKNKGGGRRGRDRTRGSSGTIDPHPASAARRNADSLFPHDVKRELIEARTTATALS